MVRDTLGLKNKVYEYNHQGRDGIKRGPRAMLIVREIGNIKNIVVPLFYGKLRGNKGKQFEEWLKKIGGDPAVPESYKLVYKLCISGYYDKNPKFTD